MLIKLVTLMELMWVIVKIDVIMVIIMTNNIIVLHHYVINNVHKDMISIIRNKEVVNTYMFVQTYVVMIINHLLEKLIMVRLIV